MRSREASLGFSKMGGGIRGQGLREMRDKEREMGRGKEKACWRGKGECGRRKGKAWWREGRGRGRSKRKVW